MIEMEYIFPYIVLLISVFKITVFKESFDKS